MLTRCEQREQLLDKLDGKLPLEERTAFNLDRWLDSYDEDIGRCVEVIDEYVKNRRALGLDNPEAFDAFYTRQDIGHFRSVFPQSKLRSDWVNAQDNGIVFVESGVRDPAKAAGLIRTGQFLYAFFAWCEQMLRLILERERQTGTRSWAVCLFDMQHVSILQYANPVGPVNRIFEARVHLAMAYYGEMLGCVVVLNPPRLLGVLFKIMSLLLPIKILHRFHIAQTPSETTKWISPEAIPLQFGGKRPLDEGELALPNFDEKEPLRDGRIWEEYAVETVDHELVVVKAGGSLVREMDAKGGQLLLYELFANRPFQLRVTNENGDYLLPHLRMFTPQLAEEGALPVGSKDTTVRWEVKNDSSWMRMKVRIALKLVARRDQKEATLPRDE